MTRIRGFLSPESFEPAVACMLFGIKGSFQISHGWIERSQFWVENKFLTLSSPPKLVSTLERASGLQID